MNLLNRVEVYALMSSVTLLVWAIFSALDSLKDWLDERSKLDNVRRLQIIEEFKIPSDVLDQMDKDGWDVTP